MNSKTLLSWGSLETQSYQQMRVNMSIIDSYYYIYWIYQQYQAIKIMNFSSNCPRRRSVGPPGGWILSSLCPTSSWPDHSHRLFHPLSCCKLCKSHLQSSFQGTHELPQFCFQLCLSHKVQALSIYSNILESTFPPLECWLPQDGHPWYTSSYLSAKDHTLAPPKSPLLQKQISFISTASKLTYISFSKSHTV